jgi:hypothetical protein
MMKYYRLLRATVNDRGLTEIQPANSGKTGAFKVKASS